MNAAVATTFTPADRMRTTSSVSTTSGCTRRSPVAERAARRRRRWRRHQADRCHRAHRRRGPPSRATRRSTRPARALGFAAIACTELFPTFPVVHWTIRKRSVLGTSMTEPAIPRMKMSANGFATSRRQATTRLEPQVRVVVHAEPREGGEPSRRRRGTPPTSMPACRIASTLRSYSRRRPRNCSARSAVSAGNSWRKTQT